MLERRQRDQITHTPLSWLECKMHSHSRKQSDRFLKILTYNYHMAQ